MSKGRLLAGGCALWLSVACGGGVQQRPTTPKAAADPRAAHKYLAGVKLLAHAGSRSEARAMEAFESALRVDPTLWEAHYNLGVLLRRRGQLRKALPHLQRAHELAPGADEPLIALAEAKHALGDHDAAAELLQQYLQDHPDANQVRVALTSVQRERADYQDALATAREALVRDPENLQALLEVGRIYKQKGDFDVAELVFEKVLALDDANATAHNDLGLLALERGDTQRAFDEFDKATKVDATFTPARMNRASVLLRAGDYAAARSEYERVLQVAPERVEARVALGICLRGLGKPRAAEKEYERALQSAPNHPAALFDLAVLRADFLDRRKQARELFERYLEVAPEGDPQRAMAKRYLSQLTAVSAAAPAADGDRSNGGRP